MGCSIARYAKLNRQFIDLRPLIKINAVPLSDIIRLPGLFLSFLKPIWKVPAVRKKFEA